MAQIAAERLRYYRHHPNRGYATSAPSLIPYRILLADFPAGLPVAAVAAVEDQDNQAGARGNASIAVRTSKLPELDKHTLPEVIYHMKGAAHYEDKAEFVQLARYRDIVKSYSLRHLTLNLSGDIPLITLLQQMDQSKYRQTWSTVANDLDDLYEQSVGDLREFAPCYMTIGLSNYSFEAIKSELHQLQRRQYHLQHPGLLSSLTAALSFHEPIDDDYIRQCLHVLVEGIPMYINWLKSNVVRRYYLRFHENRIDTASLLDHINSIVQQGITDHLWQLDSNEDIRVTLPSTFSDFWRSANQASKNVLHTFRAAYILGVATLSFGDLIETNIDLMDGQTDFDWQRLDKLLTVVQQLYRFRFITTSTSGFTLTPLLIGFYGLNNTVKANIYGLLDANAGPRYTDANVRIARTIDPSLISNVRFDTTVEFRPYTYEEVVQRNRQRNRYRQVPLADDDSEIWIYRIHQLQGTS